MPAKMGWREAAIEVLKNEPEGLSYTEISERIIERKLRLSFGANPAGSVNVAVSNSIRFDEDTPFERISTGRYRLIAGPGTVTAAPAVKSSVPDETPEVAQKKQTTGLINALGMYWSRGVVNWASSVPKLLGRQTTASESVDFADQRGVYLLYDRSEVIYVGRAIDQGIGSRLRQHITDRLGSRWDRFSWFGILGVAESGKLIAEDQAYDQSVLIATMEALLIESVEPRQNRRRGDDFQAIEYLQVEDPEIERLRRVEVLRQLSERL